MYIQPFFIDIVIELPELPKDYQRYILDDVHNPVVCGDETTWREFMSKPENVLVAQDSVGEYKVVTVFLGFNRFNVDQPIFFQTTVFGVNEHSHGDAATWKQAQGNHYALLEMAIELDEDISMDSNRA